MLRWIAVLVLIAAAGLTTWAAIDASAPRGLAVRVYDNPNWNGEPVSTDIWRHVDFGPDQNRNNFQLPDDSSLRMDGWVYAPRRGEYTFELRSRDAALLFVSDTLVVSHDKRRADTAGTIDLQKGFHRIRLNLTHHKGGCDFWLRWKLPSGYMDVEALQPVFLRPVDPAESIPTPTPLKAAPIILLLLALFVALLPQLAGLVYRLRHTASFRRHVAGGVLVFMAAFGVRAIDIDAQGETSDEWAYAAAGRIYVSNIAHGYYQSIYWRSNQEHPPLAKYLYGAVSHVTGSDSYTPLRLTSAVLGALTIVLTWIFALRFLSVWTAIISSVVLIFLPHNIAHAKIAALDSPSMFMFTLTMVMFAFAQTHSEGRNRRFLLVGLLGCLAFCTKFSNALVFVLMVAAYLAREWQTIRRTGAIRLPITLYILPALPMLVLLVVWPWLWREPFGQMIETLEHWNYPITEWFLGSQQMPPWFYYPVYFLLTTPALLLIGFAWFWFRLVRERRYSHLMVALWFFVPFLWSVSTLKQDGVRYIVTMFPAFGLAVGLGVEGLVRAPNWRPVAALATGLYTAWQALVIHPYYLDYYSELFGGTRGVYQARLGETGWWGEGIDRAVVHLNAAAPRAATWKPEGIVDHTFDGLRPDLRRVETAPDIIVDTNITPESETRPGYVVHFRLEADGAPIVLVQIKADLVDSMLIGPVGP